MDGCGKQLAADDSSSKKPHVFERACHYWPLAEINVGFRTKANFIIFFRLISFSAFFHSPLLKRERGSGWLRCYHVSIIASDWQASQLSRVGKGEIFSAFFQRKARKNVASYLAYLRSGLATKHTKKSENGNKYAISWSRAELLLDLKAKPKIDRSIDGCSFGNIKILIRTEGCCWPCFFI